MTARRISTAPFMKPASWNFPHSEAENGDGATMCSWETRGLKKSRTYLPADFLSMRDGGRRRGHPECLFGGQESAYSVRYHMADLQPRVEQDARYEY